MSNKASQSTSDKLIAKVNKQLSFIDLASAGSKKQVAFEEIDVAKLKKAERQSKIDDGKITPLINYVSDENGTV